MAEAADLLLCCSSAASPVWGRTLTRLALAERLEAGRPHRECRMSINPVRLNHAVLFVADLARAEQFYVEVFGMVVADRARAEQFYVEVFGMVVAAREPRANAAFLRLPRSGNHHDLGLFGVGPTAAQNGAARSGSTTWPGRSTPSTNSSRPATP
jgi:catechol-2,3-dioxygenase